ncbi:MAG: DUF4350 domain-containing protein [Coriobacteriia bacterium]|nr:DUF4350 domain-containing protein [Coriobacteriia bacterium]
MKRRLDIDPVLAVALAVTLAVIGLYAFAVSAAFNRASERIPVPSIYSSAPEGLRVLYRYLDESGVDVRPLRRIDELPASGALVVAGDAPLQVDLAPEHVRRLAGWVRAGGTLVLAGDAGLKVLDALDLPAAVARGVAGEVRPLVQTPLTEGVRSVAAETGRVLPGDPRWVRVLGDDAGALVLVARVDDGEVVWLADAGLLTNEHIAQADNALLALRVFGRRQPVWFDEYHQGFARGGSAFEHLAPGGQAAVVLAGLGIALMLIGVGRRTGPPVAPVRQPEARGLAYIEALAALYRRAGARREALTTLHDGLVRALARRYGSPAAGARRHRTAADALARAEAVLARDTIPEDEFREAARLVAAARREVER